MFKISIQLLRAGKKLRIFKVLREDRHKQITAASTISDLIAKEGEKRYFLKDKSLFSRCKSTSSHKGEVCTGKKKIEFFHYQQLDGATRQ